MSTIDPAHLAEEWATDDEILRNMAEGGDMAHVVREINVQFVGAVSDLNKLKNDAAKEQDANAQTDGGSGSMSTFLIPLFWFTLLPVVFFLAKSSKQSKSE